MQWATVEERMAYRRKDSSTQKQHRENGREVRRNECSRTVEDYQKSQSLLPTSLPPAVGPELPDLCHRPTLAKEAPPLVASFFKPVETQVSPEKESTIKKKSNIKRNESKKTRASTSQSQSCGSLARSG